MKLSWLIGSFLIENVVPQANGESSKVKVKVRVNINGVFSVSSATMTEKIENSLEDVEPMDVDGTAKDKKPVENGKEADKVNEDMAQESQDGAGKETDASTEQNVGVSFQMNCF